MRDRASAMTAEVKRQTRWQRKLRDVDDVSDALGRPVDAGIRDTVAILQLLGLETYAGIVKLLTLLPDP